MERESMPYDVVIVGAGPAGLSAACKLRMLDNTLSVCVVEKASEVGAHILSGAVFESRGLDELFPHWKEEGAPVTTAVTSDEVYWLNNDEKALKIPSMLVPKTMHNDGNYIISLGNLCRWLATKAEDLGVEIYPGFVAAEIFYNEDGSVGGVITGDMGVDANGSPKDTFMPGMILTAKYTLFAEGCRGHLGKQLISQFALDKGKEPQHYGLGIKEIWQVPAEQHQPGLVVHTAGWPLNEHDATGGGFLYHTDNNQVVCGLITDLDYTNPHLSPFDEFQRYKHHPVIRQHLQDATRISYGARAISKGGLQSQPKMVMPGALLIGDNAGTLNFAKIKGSHTAMKTGLISAQCIVQALVAGREHDTLDAFELQYTQSWAYQELYQQRNFAPAIHKFGALWGGAYGFFDLNICNGKLPWTLSHPRADHEGMRYANTVTEIIYPKPDGKLSFDKLSSVFLSNVNHEEDQPSHLKLADSQIAVRTNLPLYNEPAQRYCPAGVYEIIQQDTPSLQINSQNCVHCKTCDIKDPSQNIQWIAPEGTGGPNYPNM
ncbi:electron transfer flavoprotein-ubiquinone oxidoreductase [Alteromonas sp. C1M14]|uniref:electron transfer flavoprotein-ubiquinone oxidoreductase n=1 Tax=Alteromonas sp. C1M14 TaxID=2841567 RepID=UPI001C09A202|nr:electron transfer flavoprotein-ubiquinone oxidoreductase [Alteromonas sp. C1M14]MBU2980016.1 electron transfer flavoprotein-ubiquinone oxidoreductase [Alteromonas sp. C1M14]